MYVPPHFTESNPDKLHAFIEQHSFGVLVSQVGGEPFVSHLPFLLDRQAGPHGNLVGHMARANPQWRELTGQTPLAVFSGPHTYISPTWYEAENVVPTWNYTAVHVYGSVRLIEDRAALLDVVERSVTVYEAAMPRPWTLDKSGPFVDQLLSQIVGFRIEIEKIKGKWKLSQNHPIERRRKVVEALRERGGDALDVAEMMQECVRLPTEDHLRISVSHETHNALGHGESERLVNHCELLHDTPEEVVGNSRTAPQLTLLGVPGSFAVCKLPAGSPLPLWATSGDLFSVTQTADELSVVCRQEAVPEGVVCERGWQCLRVAGAMPFTAIGVLASLTTPVAKAGVGVFAVSTFDTDYLLIKAVDMAQAVAALRLAGHRVDAERVMP